MKIMLILLNILTIYGYLSLTNEKDNLISKIYFAPIFINLYISYVSVNLFFDFYEAASYTLMMCLAVDLDITKTK